MICLSDRLIDLLSASANGCLAELLEGQSDVAALDASGRRPLELLPVEAQLPVLAFFFFFFKGKREDGSVEENTRKS